ncbi:hypothetical protein D9M71_789620 [compost metagenome]
MTTLEQIVKSESMRDLLSVLAISLVFPSIDRLFSRYRFEVITNGELVRIYERLSDENVLAEGSGAIAIQGPRWEAPKFLTNKKYM